MSNFDTWLSRPSPEVAPDLLGCVLVRQIDGITYRGTIIETEAYAPGDPACHAYVKKSDRNAAMFGAAGTAYIYLIYGIYHCLNIVADGDGVGSAVLIRSLALDQIPPWIDPQINSDRVAAGPGKLCRALKIDRSLNGLELNPNSGQDSGMWLEPRTQMTFDTVQTTRIGLTKGTDIPWRWYIKDHPAVSKL